MCHILYIYLVIFVFLLNNKNNNTKRRKQVLWCTLKVVFHVRLLIFAVFLIMYNNDINEK